ncbi:FtsK/SpoIIIE domain-containing protein [Heyndrickxia camelliae]|uniref:FtsK domain-containing protein n=1 Tax=Heyndrickxia camelliae TaxID=1707093 RepID=A0A2N3LEB0_9BACI|nr:FtsK/SpoIIIE domain-containing protein [Heyndrickxia camelliae]PKR82877.1 hypothetical protein CWO92_22060 [Heyndrickxia camelliae]
MSITRIINKTPIQNKNQNIYEVEEINSHTLRKIFDTRFNGEGVYCMESYAANDYIEKYLVTPSFDKFYEYSPTNKEWDFQGESIKDLSVYELVLSNPLFMPLDTKQFVNLFEVVQQMKHTPILIQILFCKRLDNWREEAIGMYEDWRSGNDDPFSNKTLRGLQNKALNVLNRMGGFNLKRNSIKEMEEKILSHGYRMECRFVVYENKYEKQFEELIKKEIVKLNLFNELKLIKVQNKKVLLKEIENRSFQVTSQNQLYSEQEIFSLLSDKQIEMKSVELNQPVKTSSITKQMNESIQLQYLYKLMPTSENRKREVDETKAELVNNALKRVGIVKKALKVNDIKQGATIQKIQFVIPPEINYTTIKKKLEDIQGAMGDKGITIDIGDKPDTINVYVPLDNRDVVYFRTILESEEFQRFREKHTLPFIVGENVDGDYLFGDLTELRHILIAGTTGSGKSVFMNLIILCLILSVPADEMMLYLIDPKLVELAQFNGFPHVRSIIADMKRAQSLLSSLCDEMDKRYEVFSKVGVRDIQGFNETQEKKMKYIVCAIDELADLMTTNKEVEDYIVRLCQKARAAGIHLIIATQRPSVDVVTGLIKANLPNRFSFSMTSQVDSKTVLDKGGAEKLLGKGDGLAKIEGSKMEFERFQSAILSLDVKEEMRIYDGLKELFKDLKVDDGELIEVKEEEPIDKLKRIIANTNETRVSELGRLMVMGNNKVHELIKELVEEGWLTKEGNRYVINVDQEELDKWRDEDE